MLRPQILRERLTFRLHQLEDLFGFEIVGLRANVGERHPGRFFIGRLSTRRGGSIVLALRPVEVLIKIKEAQ
jgi:hypothetical protein